MKLVTAGLPLARRGFGLLLTMRLRATAARMRSFKAASSTLSPSWMSMARLTLPSRLELNKPEGSFNTAPLANVVLTTFLYVLPVHTIPPWDQTGVHPPLPLFDDLWIGLGYDFAHSREHLPAPVPKFLDSLVDQRRGRSHRYAPFHVQLQLSQLSERRNLRKRKALLGRIWLGRPFRNESSKDMAFPHPKSR